MKPIVLGPGETRPIEGHPARIKASSEDCDNRFCVLQSTIDPGPGPVLHLHRKHIEAFYVLDGALTIQAGTETIDAPAGSFALAPAGSPHTFANPGPGPATFLSVAAPGGIDHFLAGLGEILGSEGPPDLAALNDLLTRFESEAILGPPPAESPVATVVAPGEGETLSVAGNTLTFKADSQETGGAFALLEYTAAPRFPGPPPHIHRGFSDLYYVLEGTLTLRIGAETLELRPGSFALASPGTVHTFSNPTETPVRFLSIVAPGGFEQFFRDLAAASADGPPDPARIADIASRYDYEPVG